MFGEGKETAVNGVRLLLLLLLLRSNPTLGGQEKRKDKKTWKSRNEEKVVGFSLVSLFPAKKREVVTQGGTRGIDHPMRRKIQGANIAKGWEDK